MSDIWDNKMQFLVIIYQDLTTLGLRLGSPQTFDGERINMSS